MSDSPKVEFWFDPICPWCWMTSRWASEVAETRGFEIAWHPISLKIINEGQDAGSHASAHEQGFRLGRLVEAARRSHGEGVVSTLYTEIGNRLHPAGRTDYDTIIEEVLEAAGLPSELAAEVESDAGDEQLRSNTHHALQIAGPDVGVPIISVNGVAFFGPVVTPAPTGDLALQLWDGIVAAASVPGFYELKRGRTSGPQF